MVCSRWWRSSSSSPLSQYMSLVHVRPVMQLRFKSRTHAIRCELTVNVSVAREQKERLAGELRGRLLLLQVQSVAEHKLKLLLLLSLLLLSPPDMDVAVVPEHTNAVSFATHHDHHHDDEQENMLHDESQDEPAADYSKNDKLTIVQWTDSTAAAADCNSERRSIMHHEDRTVNLISFSTSSENPKTPVFQLKPSVASSASTSCFASPSSSSPLPPLPPPPPHHHQQQQNFHHHHETDAVSSCETADRKPVLLNNDSTMKKGLLWQMKDGGGFFNRWKERYFILTKDYLTCFKKSSSNLSFMGSEMGSFAYKLKLLEIESITWKSCSDCSTRSRIIPRSMRTIGRKNKNKNKGNHTRSQSSDHNHKSSDGEYSGTESSDNTSSTRTMSRKGSLKSGVREVISIVVRETGSQIDLWTPGDACLNDWMFMLKESCNHSKGRREALIKKSLTLCAPSPSHQPFALSSYWATASRKSQDRLPNERTCHAPGGDVSEIPYLKSYSSLRIGSKPSSTSLSSGSSTNCHQKKSRGFAGNRRGAGDAKSGNQRSESMMNFSKRLSILTGKEVLFPAADEDEIRMVMMREDEYEDGSRRGENHHQQRLQSNQSPHRQDHSSASSSVIRTRDRMPPLPPSPPLGEGDQRQDPGSIADSADDVVQYRHHHTHHQHQQQEFGSAGSTSQNACSNNGMRGEQGRIVPPLRQSSLVSLDRRLITRSGGSGSGGGGPAAVSQSNLHSHHHPHPLPPLPANNNDSVRRSALLRSASGIATTGAAGQASFSTLTQANHNNCNSSSQTSPSSGCNNNSSLMSQPVPRSLQVSPALTQRSLYAQHIFSQPDVPSPAFCTTSRVTSSSSGSGRERSSCGTPLSWMRDELLRHTSGSRQDNYNGSSMKSATSEFSFCRPDSPLTLPYNKSRSFYGRPVSTGGLLSSNPSIHAACNPGASGSTVITGSGGAGMMAPPRPPLPKQVSLEESSTLFRCSAAATQARARAAAAAAAAAASAKSVSLGSTGSAFSTSIDSSSGGSCSTTSSSARSSSLVPESAADFISRPSSCHYDPRSEMLEDLTSHITLTDDKGTGTSSRKSRMNRILEKTTSQFSR